MGAKTRTPMEGSISLHLLIDAAVTPQLYRLLSQVPSGRRRASIVRCLAEHGVALAERVPAGVASLLAADPRDAADLRVTEAAPSAKASSRSPAPPRRIEDPPPPRPARAELVAPVAPFVEPPRAPSIPAAGEGAVATSTDAPAEYPDHSHLDAAIDAFL